MTECHRSLAIDKSSLIYWHIMGFITIGIRATCRWQFGNQMSFGIWVYQSIESSRHWVTGKLDWIVGIIFTAASRVGITSSKEGTFTKKEKPLFVILFATKHEGDVSRLSAAQFTNQAYRHFQEVHSDEQLLQYQAAELLPATHEASNIVILSHGQSRNEEHFFLAISIDTPNSILLYYFWWAGSRTIFIMSSAERDALRKILLSCILLIIGSKASKLKWIEENKISWVAASNGKKWQCPNLFTREKRHHFTCLANEREWRNLNSAGEGETRNQLSRNPIENNPDLYYPIRSAREMKNATHSRVSQLI